MEKARNSWTVLWKGTDSNFPVFAKHRFKAEVHNVWIKQHTEVKYKMDLWTGMDLPNDMVRLEIHLP